MLYGCAAEPQLVARDIAAFFAWSPVRELWRRVVTATAAR